RTRGRVRQLGRVAAHRHPRDTTRRTTEPSPRQDPRPAIDVGLLARRGVRVAGRDLRAPVRLVPDGSVTCAAAGPVPCRTGADAQYRVGRVHVGPSGVSCGPPTSRPGYPDYADMGPVFLVLHTTASQPLDNPTTSVVGTSFREPAQEDSAGVTL